MIEDMALTICSSHQSKPEYGVAGWKPLGHKIEKAVNSTRQEKISFPCTHMLSKEKNPS